MNTKSMYFDVTGVTRAETLVTRKIKASNPTVAKRKMRRKIKGIRSLQTHLSPSQESVSFTGASAMERKNYS